MRLRGGRAGPLGQTLAAVAVSSCFAGPALANPTGQHVVRGTADIHRVGNLLQITNSPNAIINWQGFSIGANEITRFIQQSNSSAVLNRVTSQNPSQILGALQSRLANGTTGGKVFLINPNGILFGQASKIDVGGLVASTLNLTNEDFAAGRHRYGDGLGKSVVNQGSITTGTGGNVYLVGPAVTNEGIVRSPHGEVVLAAGKSVELVNPGTPNLRVEVVAADNSARNLGQIVADAGRIGIYAGLVSNSGTVRADSAVAEGGRIVLKATKNATLEAGSVTSASGATGGSITVQSGDTTLIAGTVEATGFGSPPAGGGVAPVGDGVVGEGGTIQVLGNLVGVIGNARVDASGETGGGTVLVGGDFQGKNPEVQNAYRSYLGPDATIRADAVTSGNGGKVIVWSDDATRAYGTISARGGARSGNGGFVEVSGRNYLDFNASVNVGARGGRAGTLLLDPQDITISNTTTTNDNQLNAGVPAGGDVAGSVFFADGGGGNFTISDEALEAQTGNIVLQASRDITVNNNLSGGLNLVNQGAGERVVLQAGRDITIGSPITTAGAAIFLEADSAHSSSGGANGTGTLTINAAVSSNGGHITLIGGGNPILSGGGISLSENQTIDAGAGGIDIALSGNAPLGVGTLGLLTQILGNPMDELHTTGPLRVGVATTAGSDGLGAGAQALLASSVTNIFPGSAIDLSPATGSTFELHAGSGGIVLDQPLTTFQSTAINTSGTLTINDPVNTSNNNLSITAANVIFGGNGSINTGTASCSGPGCPVSTRFWDGGGGLDKSWFNPLNWSGDTVPTLSDDVRIDSGFGTILISGNGAAAKSLLANSALEVASTGSLSLTSASQFTQQFTLAGGSLLGSGSAAVTGATGSLTWSGGTMGSGGAFLLGSASSGTLSNTLSLHRLFENQGTLTLSGATVGGTGSVANSGLLAAVAGTSNAINTPLVNTINTTLGTIQVNGMLAATNFPTNAGIINIGATGTLSTGNASLTNDAGATLTAAVGGTLNLGAGSFTNSGSATFDGTYNVATTNAAAGTLTLNGAASTATLNLAGGTVTGSGDLSVTTDFNQTGGTLGATFSDLVLNRSGNFVVGAAGITAVDSVKLIATGDITLNGAVAATNGTGDAIVLAAGGNFANNVGSSVLNPGSGRWLVYSTSPGGSFENGLTGVADPSLPRLYGRTYPGTVAESGSHLLYSAQPTVTVTPDNKTKVYGADDPAQTYVGTGFINDDGVIDTGATAGLGGSFSRAAGEAVGSRAIMQGTFASSAGYQVAFAGGRTLTISQADVTGSIGNQTKTYGADDPALGGIGVTLGGLVNRTVSTWNGGVVVDDSGLTSSASGLTRAAGENVGAYNITAGTFGAPSADYKTPVLTGVATLTIAKANTTASIANQAKAFGANDPALGGIGVTLGGLINRTVATWNGNVVVNDNGLTSSVSGLTRAVGENVGAYNVTAGAFGAPSANYNAPVLAGSPTLTIQPAALAVTADPQSKVFGSVDPALSFQAAGLVSAAVTDWNGNVTAINDTPGTAFSGSLTRSAGETVGAYGINQGTLAASNYSLSFTGNNLAITPDLANFQWAAGGSGTWDIPSNWNQGVLPLANSIVTIPGLSASDTITYSSASGTTNLASISSTASFSVSGGTLNLSGTGSLASSFPSLTLAGGTLGGNGTINAPTLNVLAGGVLGGSRIINGDVSNLGGVVAMGASPGTITINGNYSQGPAGTLLAEIAGTAASQYDQLVVNGNAVLDGALRVNLLNGYVPADGESFTFVQSSGSLTGTFTSTNFPASPSFSAGYLPASMFVAVSGIVVPSPAEVASASQIVVALTDQNQNTLVASQATGMPLVVATGEQQEQDQAMSKKPICNASSSGGGGGGGGGFGLGGGSTARCTSRGCF